MLIRYRPVIEEERERQVTPEGKGHGIIRDHFVCPADRRR